MTLTQTGVIAGTPHYMSPEQARGEAIDHRSDLFSLGCLLYFLCTGRPPFDADNALAVLHKIINEKPTALTHWRSDLPPSFVKLVHSLLQRSIDRRPQDCQAVIDELDKAQAEQQRGRTRWWKRKPSRQRSLVLGSLGALVVVATWGYSRLIIARFTYSPSTMGAVMPSTTPQPDTTFMATMSMDDTRFSRVTDHIVNTIDDPRLTRQYEHLARQLSRPSDVTLLNDSLQQDDTHWARQVAQLRLEMRELSQRTQSSGLPLQFTQGNPR